MDDETAEQGTVEKEEDESSGRVFDPMAAKRNAEGAGHDEAAEPTDADGADAE